MKYREGEYPDEWHDASGNFLFECSICNDRFRKEDMKKTPVTNEDICEWCFEEGWVACECGEAFPRDNRLTTCPRCGLDPKELT